MFTIRKLSQSFVIHDPPSGVVRYLESMVNQQLKAPKLGRDRGKITVEEGDHYYFVDMGRNDHYYSIAHYDLVIQAIEMAKTTMLVGSYEVIEYDKESRKSKDVKYKGYGFDLRVPEDDPEIFDFYGWQNPVSDEASKMDVLQSIFEVQTGRGKTKCFQKVQVRVGKRTLIITKSGYVPKWRTDTCDKGSLNEVPGRVRVAGGIGGIEALFKDAEAGELDRKNVSTIIIGTKSLKLWLAERSNGGVSTKFPLYEFYDRLGVGFVGYDEIHEHFHAIYLAGIVLNPPKTVEMSATLKPGSSKDFIRKRYLERFPLANRLNVPYVKVVKTAFIYYSIQNNHFAKRINNMKMYSHNEFEKMIYKCKMRDEYFDMVYDLLSKSFFSKYEKGQRALVFFSLIQTCTDFTEYLKKKMAEDNQPNLRIRRYIGTDKYTDLMESEIAVSTPGKAGTAVDLPKLTVAIVSPAIDDRQLNEQIAGRPRKLKDWPERDPLVLFLHCNEISKHHKYFGSRKTALTPVVISTDVIHSSYRLCGTNPYSGGGNGRNNQPNFQKITNSINRYKNKANQRNNFNRNKWRPKKSNKWKSKKRRSGFNRWN